jgi:hypothetical protein
MSLTGDCGAPASQNVASLYSGRAASLAVEIDDPEIVCVWSLELRLNVWVWLEVLTVLPPVPPCVTVDVGAPVLPV